MIAVIGDVHGCYYTLVELFNKIKEKYSTVPIYCVGDLVDRGNNSYEVIKFVKEEKILFTPGNHDYMFYHFFKDPDSIFARSWIFNGSESTIQSYEKHGEAVFEHIEFIKSAPFYFNLPDCFISHAGISIHYHILLKNDFEANIDLFNELVVDDFKTDRGILWTRDSLMNIGKLQIIGHTKHQEITFDQAANCVYIDTGACVGNKLSCVIIEDNKIVDVIDVKPNLNDII